MFPANSISSLEHARFDCTQTRDDSRHHTSTPCESARIPPWQTDHAGHGVPLGEDAGWRWRPDGDFVGPIPARFAGHSTSSAAAARRPIISSQDQTAPPSGANPQRPEHSCDVYGLRIGFVFAFDLPGTHE